MAKLYDEREVEYAYVEHIGANPNIKIEEDYTNRISIQYILKTADKEILGHKNIEHYFPSKNLITATEFAKLVSEKLEGLIAADKKALSGFKE